MWENTVPGTEFPLTFCAGIDPLRLLFYIFLRICILFFMIVCIILSVYYMHGGVHVYFACLPSIMLLLYYDLEEEYTQ